MHVAKADASLLCVLLGLMYPEDGMKKLRQMEMQTGIWTMRVQLIIDDRDIVVMDRQTSV